MFLIIALLLLLAFGGAIALHVAKWLIAAFLIGAALSAGADLFRRHRGTRAP